MIGGRVVNGPSENAFCAASQAILDMLHDHLHASLSPKRYFSSYNLALPAGHFRNLGDFYEFRAEDRDLCDCWLMRGYELTYSSAAVVQHAG